MPTQYLRIRFLRAGFALLLLLLAAGLPFLLRPSASHAGTLPVAVGGQPLPSLAPMLAQVMPAVVNINSKTRVRVRNPLMEDPFFRQFFGMPDMPRERIEQSLGSGVIIDAAKGYVLTNNHVIAGADDIAVTLHDGRTLKAQVVGTDPDTDIAVIRIPAENLSALPLADSSRLRVGDFVVALGDPFGLGQTVTSGIVSALNRSGLRGLGYQNFIQTDASINPGNSGGALVNLRGELVGINSAIYSPSGGNVGIGFAIPSNLAGQVMRQLIATGTVAHGSLGISAQDITPDIAAALGVNAGSGALITRVRGGSPAAAAGIAPGDVVTAVDGKPVRSAGDLMNEQGILPVGSKVQLDLLRDGKALRAETRLDADKLASTEGGKVDARLRGAQLSEVDPNARRDGLAGVRVDRVAGGSRAQDNGLRPGDLIVGVDQVDVAGLDDLRGLLARYPRRVLLSVVRGRNALFVPLR
ncbi:MAG: Do family serine endopeptidase [Xanthomonadaceae bacterium]|nr:Do family serine endopeptidase [Xanthomonadaceae bacterium]MDE1961319.1 Do family serine endopeptidase [Xanthomonadaceae bacterium]MDE2083456.1 Do family serine endopeptidase [Xanthomonadaceae bacterium]MDE2257332.1 Do family serine endopeptidase [Xanthomonadaceae bacterium]